jgi:DNA-binding HxlR family transcriptional regulator
MATRTPGFEEPAQQVIEALADRHRLQILHSIDRKGKQEFDLIASELHGQTSSYEEQIDQEQQLYQDLETLEDAGLIFKNSSMTSDDTFNPEYWITERGETLVGHLYTTYLQEDTPAGRFDTAVPATLEDVFATFSDRTNQQIIDEISVTGSIEYSTLEERIDENHDPERDPATAVQELEQDGFISVDSIYRPGRGSVKQCNITPEGSRFRKCIDKYIQDEDFRERDRR